MYSHVLYFSPSLLIFTCVRDTMVTNSDLPMSEFCTVQFCPSSALCWGKKLYQHRLHRVMFWSFCGYNILNIKIQQGFLMKYYLQSHASSQSRFVVICPYPGVAVPDARLWGGCACLPTCDTPSSSLSPRQLGHSKPLNISCTSVQHNPPSSSQSHKQHQGTMFAYCVKEFWKHFQVYKAL